MKFTPKTEEQLAEESLLEPGIYDFEIVEASEAISKSSGNEMLVLKLRIFSDRGNRLVTDYITSSLEWKLRHFADSVGLLERYNQGELYPEDIGVRGGKLELKIDKGNGTYKPKNSVKDYIPGTGAVATPELFPNAVSYSDIPVSIPPLPPLQDDDIPF